MRNLIVFTFALGCAGAAAGADTAQCDAKPFTLNKPKAVAPQKPVGTSAADAAKAKPATPKAVPKTSANQAKAKLIGDCKEPKKG